MKKCNKCGDVKEFDGFSKSKRDGYCSICKECMKEYRKENKDKIKEQMKEYRKENKDKIKEQKKEYYKENKNKIKEYYKEYYKENKDKIKEQTKEYYKENKDKIKEYYKENKDKIKEQTKEYRKENKDKMKEQNKEYYKENKDKIKEQTKEYRKENALYETYKEKLTPTESPRLHKDGEFIEVKCRYCGKYFIPNNAQIQSRISAINNYGGKSLYCSQGCKKDCPIYGQVKHPKDFKPSTSREVQPELRQMVLARDDYTCQKCGIQKTDKKNKKVQLHCHHIYPLNESPITSADADECITLCKDCHKEVHMNVDGCGYGQMKCSILEKEIV